MSSVMSFRKGSIHKRIPKKYLRKHVAHEIQVAITYFKNLVPVMDRFVYNDGTRKDMVCLTGTVPVLISDKTYNIPINLWIEENYPQVAPICFLKPTREMMIVRGKYVSSNGEIQMPYLEQWNNGECDLVSLLQVMVAMFGEFPPVCMQPYPVYEKSCSRELHRQADGSLFLSLTSEDGQPFQQENETNC